MQYNITIEQLALLEKHKISHEIIESLKIVDYNLEAINDFISSFEPRYFELNIDNKFYIIELNNLNINTGLDLQNYIKNNIIDKTKIHINKIMYYYGSLIINSETDLKHPNYIRTQSNPYKLFITTIPILNPTEFIVYLFEHTDIIKITQYKPVATAQSGMFPYIIKYNWDMYNKEDQDNILLIISSSLNDNIFIKTLDSTITSVLIYSVCNLDYLVKLYDYTIDDFFEIIKEVVCKINSPEQYSLVLIAFGDIYYKDVSVDTLTVKGRLVFNEFTNYNIR